MSNTSLALFVLLCLNYSLSFAQNNALLLNGVNDYAEMSDQNELDFIDQMSIEAWIKPMTEISVADQVIVGKQWCYGSDFAYYFGVFDNKLRFAWNTTGNCNSSSSFETNSQVISAGQCFHVAVVFSSTAVQFYVDGTPVTGALALGNHGTIHNSNSPLRIGCYQDYSGVQTNFFHGELDEIRIWNYELSQSEINGRMNNSLLGSETGLSAYYEMNSSGAGSGLAIQNSATSTGSSLDGVTYGTGTTPEFVPSCFASADLYSNDLTSQIEIYPNPSHGVFNVKVSAHETVLVEVYDATGKRMDTVQMENGILNLSFLEAGIYFITVQLDKGLTCQKVVIN